jgi:osomolarity two-component system phosphorelay intermediate protein YPD1
VTAAEDDADEAEDEAEADTDADGVVIDMETFEQIIELDDEDDFSFSWGMVTAYFEQAEQAFSDMDTALYVPTRPPFGAGG